MDDSLRISAGSGFLRRLSSQSRLIHQEEADPEKTPSMGAGGSPLFCVRGREAGAKQDGGWGSTQRKRVGHS